jgi:hypothetical protein
MCLTPPSWVEICDWIPRFDRCIVSGRTEAQHLRGRAQAIFDPSVAWDEEFLDQLSRAGSREAFDRAYAAIPRGHSLTRMGLKT